MSKIFKHSPLPFTGQKRGFLKQVEQVLKENIPGEGEGWTVVDVFGGSGLLAHTAKRLKPKARVIYNDFDGFSERVKHISDTNRLRQRLYKRFGQVVATKGCFSQEQKQAIIKEIEAFEGYKDLNSLASWLLFSGKQVASFEDLYLCSFWNCIRKTDYPEAMGYLDGIEVVSESFHQLMPQFQNDEKTLFLLDPPYICTHQASYKQESYFDLIDFLRLIDLIRPPYLFFSSTKSEFIRFLAYMVQNKKENWQSFEGAERIVVNAAVSCTGKYEDNLVYKFRTN